MIVRFSCITSRNRPFRTFYISERGIMKKSGECSKRDRLSNFVECVVIQGHHSNLRRNKDELKQTNR